MAKIQNFKRLIAEDFDEKDRELVNKIAYAINVFAEDVTSAFSNGLSIQDNLNQKMKDITVTVDGNGVPKSPLIVKSGLSGLCRGMQVINHVNNTNNTLSPTSQPYITFIDNSGQINISKISGLQANQAYTLRVILYP